MEANAAWKEIQPLNIRVLADASFTLEALELIWTIVDEGPGLDLHLLEAAA